MFTSQPYGPASVATPGRANAAHFLRSLEARARNLLRNLEARARKLRRKSKMIGFLALGRRTMCLSNEKLIGSSIFPPALTIAAKP